MVLFPLVMAFFAVLLAGLLSYNISRKDDGTPKMREISKKIKEGAMTFLFREYRIMADFAVVIFILIAIFLNLNIAIAFVLAITGGVLAAPRTLAGGTMGTSLAIKGFAGAVIGGIGNPIGVVLGSLLVGVIESNVSGAISYGYRDPVVYILLILVLMIRPYGLFASGKESTS